MIFKWSISYEMSCDSLYFSRNWLSHLQLPLDKLGTIHLFPSWGQSNDCFYQFALLFAFASPRETVEFFQTIFLMVWGEHNAEKAIWRSITFSFLGGPKKRGVGVFIYLYCWSFNLFILSLQSKKYLKLLVDWCNIFLRFLKS